MKNTCNKKAFTLIEIIVVTVIVGVSATLAIPKLTFSVEKTKSSEGVQILDALYKAQVVHSYENAGSYAANINDLDVTIPGSEHFKNPNVNSGGSIVSIERNDSNFGYTLSIAADATITCTGGSGSTCSKLGF